MNIKEILSQIPDKWETKTTTTKKFKLELYEFCIKNNIKSALEIGSSTGITTYFLAQFLERVTCVESSLGKIADSVQRNTGIENIKFYCADVYQEEWNFGQHDLIIIDCLHSFDAVFSDIENALTLEPNYLVFDDYGLFPEVKKAIDTFINEGILEIVEHIGYSKGSTFDMSVDASTVPDKILIDSEGIICKVIK